MTANTERLFVIARSHCEDCRGTGVEAPGGSARLCAICDGKGHLEVQVSLGEVRDWIASEMPKLVVPAAKIAEWHSNVEIDLTRAANTLKNGEYLPLEERRQLHGLVQDAAQSLRSILDLQGRGL